MRKTLPIIFTAALAAAVVTTPDKAKAGCWECWAAGAVVVGGAIAAGSYAHGYDEGYHHHRHRHHHGHHHGHYYKPAPATFGPYSPPYYDYTPAYYQPAPSVRYVKKVRYVRQVEYEPVYYQPAPQPVYYERAPQPVYYQERPNHVRVRN